MEWKKEEKKVEKTSYVADLESCSLGFELDAAAMTAVSTATVLSKRKSREQNDCSDPCLRVVVQVTR
jgi:hypothetical protein